ncbi:transposase [Anaeromyxobacter sp. Red801]|uniref:transposase n=1 Tax=Anaeromyxobacter sp. Red801 TaxID=3411632 RepID=UPI003BA3900F
MARIPRFALVERDSSNHCTWRAHDFEHVLEVTGARDKFLELLGRYKDRYGVEINSYCLMGTHPHVTCTTRRDQEQFSRFWQVVNGQFARWYNKRRDRRGQVVMERMRSPRIQAEGAHQLTVMRYGDLNPVRAGLVKSPKDWKWSSYRHYAFGEPDPLIDDAPEYLALGNNGPQRRKAYQALFALPLSESLRTRRIDLVEYPFVGDAHWVMHRLDEAGLSPPD